MLIVYINSQVVLLPLYTSLKMTAKSKIFAQNLVKKLAFMLADENRRKRIQFLVEKLRPS